MDPQNRDRIGSEGWGPTTIDPLTYQRGGYRVLGYTLLVSVPLFLMLVVLAGKFQGLWAVMAADQAQLARHIAAGEGFVTSFIRPLSLVFQADLRHHPDLYNAPLYPLLLGLVYAGTHASDRITAATGAGLWIISVWLTFWVARRWFGTSVAFLAALFYGCNVAGITAAIGGLPQPLMAILVLLAVWLAFSRSRDKSLLFRRADLRRAGDLILELRAARDPLSQYLWDQFSPATRQLLEEYDSATPPSEEMQSALIAELNQLLRGPCLYDPQRFAQIPLAEEAWALLEFDPQGSDLVLLNRLLLQEAYPGKIAKNWPEEEQEEEGKEEQEEKKAGESSDSPPPREFTESLPGWHVGLVGVVCSLAALTHYLLVGVAFILGLYLMISQRSKGRTLGWFLSGFLLPLIPWMWRNFQWSGSPLFSLFWYELLASTSTYPGESLWRMAELPPHPLFFLMKHSGELFRKIMINLDQFWDTGPSIVNPVVGFLFLAALMGGTQNQRRSWLLAVIAGSLGWGIASSCLLRSEPGLLLAWVPLMAILGAAFFSRWVAQRFNDRIEGFTWTNPWSIVAGLVTIVVLGFPLAFYILFSQPGLEVGARGELLNRFLSPGAIVMTDQPAFIAWYARRQGVWLCQREKDWVMLEQVCGSIDAAYVTSAITQMNPRERPGWWDYLVSYPGNVRGLVPVPEKLPHAVLKVRPRARKAQTGQRAPGEES